VFSTSFAVVSADDCSDVRMINSRRPESKVAPDSADVTG
jgi:hypothetical protein